MRYAAIFTFALVLTTAAQAQIAWEDNLTEAHSKAKQQGKLLLLHFYSDNCVWCDKLEARAFQSLDVAQALNRDFVAVKIHGTKNPKLTSMFKVSKYPTDVVVTIDGKPLVHQFSPQDPARYVSMLAGAKTRLARNQVAAAKRPPAAPKAPTATPRTAASSTSGLALPAAMPEAKTMARNSIGAQTAPQLPVQVPSPNASVAATRQTLPPMPSMTAPATKSPGPKGNEFVLPSKDSAGVTASLASARTQSPPPVHVSSAKSDEAKHELAIEGYCAVSVIENGEWIEGNKEFGVVHLGKLYLFANKTAMETFLADPMPYTPMLDEIDIVRFFEEKRIVRGRREWGVIDPIHHRMYFFADKDAMIHFENTFEAYLDAAMEVMDKAVTKANPGL